METFAVPSKSRQGHTHTVRIDGDESDCTCEAASFGKPCRHVAIARELKAREQSILERKTMAENIHQAIAEVYGKVGYVQKQRAKDLNYTFAGERALIDAIRPHLVEAGIYMHVAGLRVLNQDTYQTARGATMNSTTIEITVRFTHAPSETFIEVQSIGTGADVGDKASPKALTGAYKYALRQTFCIETGDDPDEQSSDEQQRASRPSGPPMPKVPAFDVPVFNSMAAEHGITKDQIAKVLDVPPSKLQKGIDLRTAAQAWAMTNNLTSDVEMALVDAIRKDVSDAA